MAHQSSAVITSALRYDIFIISSIHSTETSHQHESEPSNGQKSQVNDETFAFGPNSFAKMKRLGSSYAPSTTNGSSDAAKATKSAGEGLKIEKDLAALKKEIMSLYGPTKDPFKLPKLNEKDEKAAFPIAPSASAIGMEIFGNKGDTVKPSFSFNLPDNNGLLANGNGVEPAKALETGMHFNHFLKIAIKKDKIPLLIQHIQITFSAISFSFNTTKETDAEKPFMFEAKSMENVSEKSTRESINSKSKLPTRATSKRMK